MRTYLQQTIMRRIWPTICVVCGLLTEEHDRSIVGAVDLCKHCYQRLPWLKNCCYQCGSQLGTVESKDAYRCKSCYVDPPAFDRFCGLFFYRFPVTRMISQLKFYRKLEYGSVLGELLKAEINAWYPLQANFPEVIIPVPLHTKRLRWRGFNQAMELLRPLIKNAHKFKIDPNLAIRIQHSKPQVKLTKHRRRMNLKHAFQITKKINYKHVAILDDVFTTGSTTTALSECLRAAGVERIDIWCICRA